MTTTSPAGFDARTVLSQAGTWLMKYAFLLGFVALSQVVVDGRIDKGSAWIVPADAHAPLLRLRRPLPRQTGLRLRR